MLALKITDQKDFTNKLFLKDTFDLFWMNQAEIITSNVFTVDGSLKMDFFDKMSRTFSHPATVLVPCGKKCVLYVIISSAENVPLFLLRSYFSSRPIKSLHFYRAVL